MSYEPNQRGLKLLDLADFFNLCPVNLLGSCFGPLEFYISHYGRYRSTTDYILLPNCLSDNIVSAKTFDRMLTIRLIIFRLKSVLATLINLLIRQQRIISISLNESQKYAGINFHLAK